MVKPQAEIVDGVGNHHSSANVSPESSTHPEISLCSNKSLDNEDLDSGVSSTTKELDLKNPLKLLKKEVDPFGGILKHDKSSKTSSNTTTTEDSKVQAKLETSVLFAPTLLPPTKTTTIKEEPNLQPSTKIKADNKKDSSSSHRSSKEGHRSSSHHR